MKSNVKRQKKGEVFEASYTCGHAHAATKSGIYLHVMDPRLHMTFIICRACLRNWIMPRLPRLHRALLGLAKPVKVKLKKAKAPKARAPKQ